MDIEKYIYSECQHPQKVWIYNGVTNSYEHKNVPCGKCYHCKITRINEWVTRMVIQSNMSNYVYYGTLTYNGKVPTIYNDECFSVLSSNNSTKRVNETPLLLRKDHLQKFFKRLRKNTSVRFQYAACGEYGDKYSRVHMHYIIWTNQPISKLDIYKAWTAPGKYDGKKHVIGNVEHRDIKHNAYPAPNDPDNSSVYKYVCKYIQKYDFDFEKLKTINQIKKVYETIDPIKDTTGKVVYLCDKNTDYLEKYHVEDWYTFKKCFSPFFVCSKKPAIGYQYLEENLGRFQDGDFKLFGLSGKYIFPLYFVRKTKEKICPFKAQSEISSGATSYSRLPRMATLIENIQHAQQIADDTEQIVQLFRYNDYVYTLESDKPIHDLEQLRDGQDTQPKRLTHYRFPAVYLGLHDIENKVYYAFRGTYFAMYDTKDNYIGQATLEDVKQLIRYYYDKLLEKVLIPLYGKSKISANKKAAMIEEYGGIDEFETKKQLYIENLNRRIEERQRKYKQSKTRF